MCNRYFLTLTCCQPLYGKLSDIFGRKGCLLFAYTIFGLGSLGCGLAQDIWQLIIARAVAGIGGGGMNAVTSILLSDIVPLRDRGMWQGYLNVIFGAGMATGAPLGGLMADSIGWRWSFIAQVPIVAAAFIACSLVLHLPSQDASNWREKMGKIDFLGAFCLVSAVLCLLIGLDNGSNAGWNKLETIVPLAISPALFVAFLLVEIKVASHPFAPGHIIFERYVCQCRPTPIKLLTPFHSGRSLQVSCATSLAFGAICRSCFSCRCSTKLWMAGPPYKQACSFCRAPSSPLCPRWEVVSLFGGPVGSTGSLWLAGEYCWWVLCPWSFSPVLG